jgi:hypothetical protein
VNTNTTATLETLQAELSAEGYRPGPPAHLSAAALEIDRQVAREAICDSCDHASLICEPWHNGGSYRCLAVCPQCLTAFEF